MGKPIFLCVSISHFYFLTFIFTFLHGNNMSTSWQLLLTFTFSLSLFGMAIAWKLLLTFTFSRSLSLFAWQQHGNRLETASQHGNCIATALSHFHFLTFTFTFCMATAWQQLSNCFSLSLQSISTKTTFGSSAAIPFPMRQNTSAKSCK